MAVILAAVDRIVSFACGNKAFAYPHWYLCNVIGVQGKWLLLGFNFLPFGAIICTCNTFLIYKAVKLSAMMETRVNSKGNLTIIVLCGAFLLAYLPYFTVELVTYGSEDEQAWIKMIAACFVAINVIVNPCIYTLTNRRFGSFMKSMIGINPT